MKNIRMLLMSVVSFALLLIPSMASAATTLPEPSNNTITLTEDVTLDDAFVVTAGQNLTLDLGEYTLTNGTNADTIRVEKGATLTIKGNGTITNTTLGKAALFNNGTVTIESGTLQATKNENSNDYYVILNHGTMTINGGTIKSTSTYSSLIDNGYYNFTSSNEREGYVEGTNELYPTLTINGGMFDGGLNTVKNDDNGRLVINDGTFKNTVQVSLMNWNEATINGGVFETPTGNDKTNIFVGSCGANSNDIGKLVITGGTFNAEHAIEVSAINPVTTPVEISGGTFNNTASFVNEGIGFASVAVEDININGEVTATTDAVKYAKKGAVLTLTDAKVDTVIDVPEGAEVVLPQDDNLVFVENEDGTVTIKEKADLTELLAIADRIDNLDKNAYTSESFKEFEETLDKIIQELDQLSFTKDEQAKIDDMVEQLENAMAKLVKVTDVENPETADNILTYVSICSLATLALGATLIYSKKKIFN